MAPKRILFLDDDPVIRVLRMVLEGHENDAWMRDYFAPERVDIGPLVDAAQGLRRADGVSIDVLRDGVASVQDASIIVFRRGQVTASMLDANPSLQFVQRLGARGDAIDVAAARARGIRVSCLPRRTLAWTAEHAMLLMLALGKRLIEGNRAVRAGRRAGTSGVDGVAYNWAGFEDVSGLEGRTLGIIGLGEVGSLVAKLATAFGMTVLYTKPRRAEAGIERSLGVRYAPLDALLGAADYVSLHAAARPETEGMADSAFFARMKRSGYFINTSRGRLVNEDALYQALSTGVIAGAGLDVHAVEPRLAGDRFATLDNVILTPHYGGGARGGLVAELRVILQNCRAAVTGGAIEHEVLLS